MTRFAGDLDEVIVVRPEHQVEPSTPTQSAPADGSPADGSPEPTE